MPSYECTRHLLVLGQTHSRVAILVQGILHGSEPGIVVLIGLGREEGREGEVRGEGMEGEGVGREGKRKGRGGGGVGVGRGRGGKRRKWEKGGEGG